MPATPEEKPQVLHVLDRRGVKLVRFRTRSLLGEAEVEAFGQTLMALAELPGQRVVLSFLGVQHLTSQVLGKLIHVHKRLTESGGEMRLADIAPPIHEIFSITRLDRLFRIYERDEEAVASFLGGAEA